jgi:hypothetical protein
MDLSSLIDSISRAVQGSFQSLREAAASSPLLVVGVGAAVLIIVLLLLIILRRRRRRSPAGSLSPHELNEEKLIESLNLDDLIAMGTDLYQTMGHTVRDVTRPSKDVADLIVDSKDGQRWIARCLAKPTINSQEVASFRKAIRKAGIPQSALITSGSFTTEALDEAARGDINTLEPTQLIEYLSKAKQIPE